MIPEFWWPIDLSKNAEKAFIDKKLRYSNTQIEINYEDLMKTNHLIEQMMKSNLQDILDRDSIPNLCHILNGWGNSKFEGRLLVDHLSSFIFLRDGNSPFIEQCTTEGDFHPWQSFAYSAMAGINGETMVGDTCFSLKQLMEGSVRINHNEGEELGHLLFALAYYFKGSKDAELKFQFDNGLFNSEELLNWAIENHFTGSFRVCRKFHLTEGICAMASLNPNFQEYKLVAQKFLEGQVDLIILISIILDESIQAIQNKESLYKESLASELREELVILDYLENHIYYAGHIIELASLALLMGYEISEPQLNAIKSVINKLNAIIPLYAPQMSFVDCFLGFGHYRRAITLFSAIEKSENKNDWNLLNKYEVNFNEIKSVSFTEEEINRAIEYVNSNVFKVTDPQDQINPFLNKVITHYNLVGNIEEFPLRGKFSHFRRVCPSNWPKSVHFEMLDYGEKVKKFGIEIHLENLEVKYIANDFFDLKSYLEQELKNIEFIIDDKWYKGCGRLYALFTYEDKPEIIAESFLKLIELTKDRIEKALQKQYMQTKVDV